MTEDSSELSVQDIESRVLEFIHRELLSSTATIDREDDLLSGEVLDSIGVLRLATFIEEELGIQIPPTSFVVENFQSVKVIAGFVHQSSKPGGSESMDSQG